MEFVPSFWQYLGRMFVVSGMVYLIGHVAMLFVRQRENAYRDLFLKVILGSILLISATATGYSGGHSVLAGVWLVVGYCTWIALRKKILNIRVAWENASRIDKPSLIVYLIFATVVFAFFYFQLTCGVTGRFGWLYEDFSFYGAIADKLQQTGIENTSCEAPVFYAPADPTFYHYFELWFAGLAGGIFGKPSVITLYLVAYPILLGATCCGAKAIADRYRLRQSVALILAPAVLFLTSYRLSFFGSPSRPFLNMGGAKLTIVLAISVWFFLLNKGVSLYLRFLPLTLLCILYPPVAPVLLCSMIITLAWMVMRREVLPKELASAIIMVLIPLGWLIVFYGFNRHAGYVAANGFSIKDYLLSQECVPFVCEILLKSVRKTYYVLYMLPFILLFASKRARESIKQNEWRCTWVLLGGMFAAGVLAISMFDSLDYNIGQLFVNVWTPFTLVVCFVVFCAFASNRPLWLSASMIGAIYIAGMAQPSMWGSLVDRRAWRLEEGRESAEVARMFGARQPRVAFLLNQFGKEVPDITLSVRIPFASVRLYRTDYYPICLSSYELPVRKDFKGQRTISMQRAVLQFNRYCQAHSLDGHSDVSKIAFLREFEIEFVICRTDDTWVERMNIPVVARKVFPVGNWTVYQVDREKLRQGDGLGKCGVQEQLLHERCPRESVQSFTTTLNARCWQSL